MFVEVCDFCVLREQILQLGEIGFSCWELFFVISESPRPIIVNIFWAFICVIRHTKEKNILSLTPTFESLTLS